MSEKFYNDDLTEIAPWWKEIQFEDLVSLSNMVDDGIDRLSRLASAALSRRAIQSGKHVLAYSARVIKDKGYLPALMKKLEEFGAKNVFGYYNDMGVNYHALFAWPQGAVV